MRKLCTSLIVVLVICGCASGDGDAARLIRGSLAGDNAGKEGICVVLTGERVVIVDASGARPPSAIAPVGLDTALVWEKAGLVSVGGGEETLSESKGEWWFARAKSAKRGEVVRLTITLTDEARGIEHHEDEDGSRWASQSCLERRVDRIVSDVELRSDTGERYRLIKGALDVSPTQLALRLEKAKAALEGRKPLKDWDESYRGLFRWDDFREAWVSVTHDLGPPDREQFDTAWVPQEVQERNLKAAP